MADSSALSVVSPADSASNSALRALKDRSAVRRKLLAQTLGVHSPDDLPSLLGTTTERTQLTHEREQRVSGEDLSDICETPSFPSSRRRGSTPTGGAMGIGSSPSGIVIGSDHLNNGEAFVIAKRLTDSGSEKTKRRRTGEPSAVDSDGDETIMEPFDDYFQVLQEEEKVYRGSATFLKGTQSANPHNDYCQHFIDTGQRPQNFIRDSGLAERFDEYPKLKELIKLKDELVAATATPPMYLKCDLRTYDLRDTGSRFDVILIEPPLEEYHISGRDCWSWDEIERLDIAAVADTRAFIWLWCGSTPDALQRGRECLKRWGFRRCEDICWVKTNKTKAGKEHPELTQAGGVRFGAGQLAAGNSLLQRTKEHCLMGIKGTVRRSTDGDFIHANVDIDLIITEEPPAGSIEKPLEIVLIAEHFCLGRRRLHLFGRDHTLRPGWLTIGPELTSSNFDASRYRHFFDRPAGVGVGSGSGSGYTTGCTDRIEQLRPKSPVPMDKRGGGMMMGHGGGGNMNSRPDGNVGGGANGWQRTSGANNRDRPRGAITGPRHMPHVHGRQQTPPLHDRERDHRFDKDTRNGMVTGGGRSDRFTSTRSYGSQRGGYSMNYGRDRGRGANGSRSGARRNF